MVPINSFTCTKIITFLLQIQKHLQDYKNTSKRLQSTSITSESSDNKNGSESAAGAGGLRRSSRKRKPIGCFEEIFDYGDDNDSTEEYFMESANSFQVEVTPIHSDVKIEEEGIDLLEES